MPDTFREAMRAFARLSDEHMAKDWDWPGHTGEQLQVRDALYRSLEDEQAARAAAEPDPTEAARILELAQCAFGDLCGLLVGLDDAVLDASPGASDWSLREVLDHIQRVDLSYTRQIRHALRRSGDEPLSLDRPVGETDTGGGIADWLDRLAAIRDQTFQHATLSGEQLTKPSRWAGYVIDVRFRLHRFASHIVEHTIQCEKTLVALNQRPTEAARIVRRIWATRGAHERRSSPEVLARLDAQHTERALLAHA